VIKINKIIIFPITSLIIISVIISGCIENSDNLNQGNIIIEGKGSYSSIQVAIDSAVNGDTIYVKEGIYNESIIINKTLNLIGEGENKSVIKYKAVSDGINENITDAFKIEINLIEIKASYCNFSGFKIVGIDTPYNLKAIKITSIGNNITNNVIMNFTDGINSNRGSKGNKISKNIIKNNKNGIYLYYSTSNNISYNSITLNSEYGIFLQSVSDNNIVTRNNIFDNHIGMRVKGSKFNEIFENNIINSSDKGMYVCCGAQKNNFYRNTFIDNFIHASDPYSNDWDRDGLGNYWDNYEEQLGFNATDNDGDGIWDEPYTFQYDSTDYFPLVEPYI
jgi:parallel beta-helix repeat protein